MTAEELLTLKDQGEASKVQFKERILDKYDIGCELVAFSNTHGGELVIGINDNTTLNSLLKKISNVKGVKNVQRSN